MDPNVFALDWEQLMEAATALVLLSIIVERALSVLFESRAFIDALGTSSSPLTKASREIIAFIVSVAVCVFWQFDLPAILLTAPKTGWPGYILTGAVIAGGSKGSIKLFREFLGFKSGAYKEYEERKAAKTGSSTPAK